MSNERVPVQKNSLRPRADLSASAGFTLLELVVTLGVLAVFTGFGYAFVSRARPNSQAGGERVLSELQRLVTTRHAQARQLNTASRTGGTSLEEGITAYDITLDFSNPETTRTLLVNGVDEDRDGFDDYTGQEMSRFVGSEFHATYTGAPLQLPAGWRIAATKEDFGTVPLIIESDPERARPARCIYYAANGSLYPAEADGRGGCHNEGQIITSTSRDQYFSLSSAPFLAIYAVFTPDGAQSPTAAVALAVYQSGYTEAFRWDGKEWSGYNGRGFDERAIQLN